MTAGTVVPEVDGRAAYTAGLRALADALDNDPLLSIPFSGVVLPINIYAYTREEVAAWARVLPGKVDKAVYDAESFGFRLEGSFGGLRIQVDAPRTEVCTRIVKGTTTVTTTVPDPDYVALAPLVERTEVVEDVEWVCGPLLADREPVQS